MLLRALSPSALFPLLLIACAASGPAPADEQGEPAAGPSGSRPARLTYEIVRSHPHDPRAFTQGLQFVDGHLYEGTGLHGESTLRRVELRSGAVLQQVALSPQYFGEGITVVGDRVIQLTWRSGVGFVYDRDTFERRRTFTYTGEGWGLTFDGQHLIMSDGTDALRFWHPETFEEVRRVQVTDGGAPVAQLNELEYFDGLVYANVWPTDRVARIDPSSGQVTGWIDFSGLLTPSERARGVDVLNGIAHDPRTGHFLVTGKLWPWVFEVRLSERR
jgi:glutaminyl-peptide cyclotransferase